jgi:hypothetical protein
MAQTEVGAKDQVHARLPAANALDLQGTGPVAAAVTLLICV